MRRVFCILCGMIAMTVSVLTFAGEDEYVYDISEQTGIKMEFIERTINNFCEERKNITTGFSVKEGYLDKAYLVTPLEIVPLITAHKEGKKLSDMAAGYGRFILPVVTNEGKRGRVTFKCEGAHLTYIGMGVANEGGGAAVLDVDAIIRACTEKDLKINDMDIYIEDMYHLHLVDIDTDKGEYIVPCAFGVYSEYGMEDNRLYKEDEFWNMMDSIFDEDAIDPEMSGGIPIRGEMSNKSNGVALYIVLTAIAVAVAGIGIFELRKTAK